VGLGRKDGKQNRTGGGIGRRFRRIDLLPGLRNKLAVLLDWTYSYFFYKRGARIITLPSAAGNERG
jgi:hypothetical protein